MRQDEINKQIFARLQKIENFILNPGKGAKKISGAKDSLPDLLLRFREQDFFSRPKSVKEVHKKVSLTYFCDIDRVSTALRRLKDRKELRIAQKNEDGQKVLAYTW